MGELKNCPSCNEFFNYTGIREVCNKCAVNEEKLYENVYRFLRKRENRAATIERIVEVTGVERIPVTQMGTQRKTTTSNVPKPRLSMR